MAQMQDDHVKEHAALIRKWFGGYDCCSRIEIVEDWGDYVLVHHKTHQSWISRIYPTHRTCGSWWVPIKKSAEPNSGWGLSGYEKYPHFCQGRLSAKKRQEMKDWCLTQGNV